MHVDFTPEQKKLRSEIRSYYRDLFTPELRAAFDAELVLGFLALSERYVSRVSLTPPAWTQFSLELISSAE